MSDAELRALPVLAVTEGRLVCTAIGADACPLRSAVANWLGNDRVALWEPGREIMILDAKSPTGRNFGVVGQASGQYAYATAVGPFKGNVAVIDLQRAKMVLLNDAGGFEREENIPRPDANSAPGFIGATPVLQSIHAANDSGVARMTLDVLESQTQTKGTRVLDVPVPWLRLNADSAIGFSPLFPASPRYAVDVNKTIIWTPSDSFWVQRRSFDGEVRWTLSSDRKGKTVTAAEISARRDEITRNAPKDYLKPGDLDSMTAHTATAHPVIGGIVLEPGGRMLITGVAISSSDSIEYIVLTRDGIPSHRFSLASRVRPLLFAGDSLLVHRPTAGEPLEVRWLFLKPRA
ncbi:MAG: hypothetical protein ABI910_11455 [Gemmatimonadota bacterium]